VAKALAIVTDLKLEAIRTFADKDPGLDAASCVLADVQLVAGRHENEAAGCRKKAKRANPELSTTAHE
jgi:hypothetical protein